LVVTKIVNQTDFEVRDSRIALENDLYDQWLKKGDDSSKQELIEQELRAVLGSHAHAVMYTVLRRADLDLVNEAVNRVMLGLSSFRGESLFTTWAHRILLGVMYDKRRLERRRKEVSLDIPGFDTPGNSTLESTDLFITAKKLLSSADWLLFTAIAVNGETQQDVALRLNISQQTISRRWMRIVRILRRAFYK
jgi:RNA polymerase sigma factor (sigma-70 family)